MLKLDHISKTFNPGTLNEKKALDQVDLHLERPHFEDGIMVAERDWNVKPLRAAFPEAR